MNEILILGYSTTIVKLIAAIAIMIMASIWQVKRILKASESYSWELFCKLHREY